MRINKVLLAMALGQAIAHVQANNTAQRCPWCSGVGRVPANTTSGDETCQTCHGTGYVTPSPGAAGDDRG